MTHLVHALGHVKINTRDVQAGVREATEILGLRVAHSDNSQVWLSARGRAAELVLVRSDENAAHTLGLEALSSDAVRQAAARAEAEGCRVVSREPSLPCIEAGITFVTPEGLRFEIHTPVRDDINARRHATVGVGANRLDHLNLLTSDPATTQRQLEAIGGLKVSERMVNNSLTWMYGGNRQHHIVGLVKGKTAGLHHYSFEFLDFTQYLRLGDTLDRFDKQLMWGPGRHRPGDNTYAYYVDTSGAMVECSGPMSQIADDDHFTPNVITNLERPGNVRTMNVWGTPAPLEWREFHFPFTSLN
jgi:catechol 2,3-dioxygenase-like lactoylglutathione lyase family enzyme